MEGCGAVGKSGTRTLAISGPVVTVDGVDGVDRAESTNSEHEWMLQQLVDSSEAPAPPPVRAVFDTVTASPLSTEEWLERLLDDVAHRRQGRQSVKTSTSLNAATVSRARRDPAFRATLAAFDYVDLDGMSLVYWSRLTRGPAAAARVATTDFIHSAARTAAAHGVSFFLLGATEDSNRAAAARLRELYPKLHIAGRHHGYVEAAEPVIEQINRSGADIVWVGMGVPAEQQFIQTHRAAFSRAAWVKSCGGCLDFVSLKAPRAPQWMQHAGLEWSFRLANEPRRLLWRYAITNPHACMLLLRQIWQERTRSLRERGAAEPAHRR